MTTFFCLAAAAAAFLAQDFPPPPPFGRGGGPGGPGFGPPPMGGPANTKLVKEFDKDGNGYLDATERQAAREKLKSMPRRGGFGGRRGGPFGENADNTPPKPGPKLTPDQVKKYGSEPLYDPTVLRTIFLEFDNPDWEAEMADFNNTDVDIPVNMTVDGKLYKGAGVHFRGMSSFMMVPAGRKRSLNLSVDFLNKDQRLHGYRTLNLLNSHGDPTFLRTVMYLDIARQYIPAPKANFLRVVINGESWGIYVSQQQFNTDFVKEWFPEGGGARWKVSGSPMGQGGLSYLGEDVAAYKRIYDIKSKDNKKDWAALINLTKVLTETPIDRLEQALQPILDIDGALRFLALEKAFVNSDGYWVRSSDYSIYLDAKGKFHVIPHDANETIRPPEGGPGMRGMANMGNGMELDPFAGSQDSRRVLISRLLAVPSLRTKYLGYMRDIAEKWMTWDKLGPMAAKYQKLIEADVKADTRKLDSLEAFRNGLTVDGDEDDRGFRRPGAPPSMSMKTFVEGRRKFLLAYKPK